jgi:hypothetical protein
MAKTVVPFAVDNLIDFFVGLGFILLRAARADDTEHDGGGEDPTNQSHKPKSTKHKTFLTPSDIALYLIVHTHTPVR